MDPTNTMPANPAPGAPAGAVPAAPAVPAVPAAPIAGAPVAPAVPAAVASAAPASAAVAPAPEPINNNPAPAPAVTPAPAVNADIANAALNPPVNPVVAPSGNNPDAGMAAAPAPVAAPPVAPVPGVQGAPAGTMSMSQMFQPQSPAAQVGVFAETTAIAAPEGPKAPDPVEEELKAPLKAAAPVPGSIGSAVSMPPEGGASPQNVAFNDPAAMANNPMAANNQAAPAGKKGSIMDKLMAKTKMNKRTLTIVIVAASVVIVLLIGILIMLAMGVL